MEKHPTIAQGAALFDKGKYFECHELLEEIWLKSEGKRKVLLQGLIQAAAGFHKLKQGHAEGAAKLFYKATQKIKKTPARGAILSQFKRKVLAKIKACPAPVSNSNGFKEPASGIILMKFLQGGMPREGIEPTRP